MQAGSGRQGAGKGKGGMRSKTATASPSQRYLSPYIYEPIKTYIYTYLQLYYPAYCISDRYTYKAQCTYMGPNTHDQYKGLDIWINTGIGRVDIGLFILSHSLIGEGPSQHLLPHRAVQVEGQMPC